MPQDCADASTQVRRVCNPVQMGSELSLLERVGRGDRAAAHRCIETYSGLVWSLARRFLSNDADAEEAVQEIFVEIWSHADRYEPTQASEATFISMIARRRLIDKLRRSQREPAQEALQEDVYTLSGAGRNAIEASAEARRVLAVIENLNPDQREVVRLSTWLGMSHGAIARRLSLPLGTVKSHLRRALLTIRQHLGEEVGG